MHYDRWRAHGDPLGKGQLGRPVVESVTPNHPLTNDAWLAGFVAGEGCFTVAIYDHGNEQRSLNPVLQIAQRDDNADVLREIHEAFGGRLEQHSMAAARREHSPGAKDQVRWTASNRLVCMRLVTYFDRFPLRSSKAAEYVIWREAVLLYVEEGGRHPGLEEARMELQRLKQYRSLAVAA